MPNQNANISTPDCCGYLGIVVKKGDPFGSACPSLIGSRLTSSLSI